LTDTRGTAVYNHVFNSFVPFAGKIEGYKKGALISMSDGITTSYALEGLEPRGILFVGPQTR
jgi:GTP-binding protein